MRGLIVLLAVAALLVPSVSAADGYRVSTPDHPHTLKIYDDVSNGRQSYEGDVLDITFFYMAFGDTDLRFAIYPTLHESAERTPDGLAPNATADPLEVDNSLWDWLAGGLTMNITSADPAQDPALDHHTFSFTYAANDTERASDSWGSDTVRILGGVSYRIEASIMVPPGYRSSIDDPLEHRWDVDLDGSFNEAVGWLTAVNRAVRDDTDADQGSGLTVDAVMLDLLMQVQLDDQPGFTCCGPAGEPERTGNPSPVPTPPADDEGRDSGGPATTILAPVGQGFSLFSQPCLESQEHVSSGFSFIADPDPYDFRPARPIEYTLDAPVVVSASVEGRLGEHPVQFLVDGQPIRDVDGRPWLWLGEHALPRDVLLPQGTHLLEFTVLDIPPGDHTGSINLERPGIVSICQPVSVAASTFKTVYPTGGAGLLGLAALGIFLVARHRFVHVPETNAGYCTRRGRIRGIRRRDKGTTPFVMRMKDFPLPQDSPTKRASKLAGIRTQYGPQVAESFSAHGADDAILPVDVAGLRGKKVPGDRRHAGRMTWSCRKCPVRSECWDPGKRRKARR